jgi:non-ribosomal peptide synthetase component E (peptide arylation enzyme)
MLTIKSKPDHLVQQYRAAGYWNDDTLYDLLAARVDEVPTKAAIITESSQLTYAEWHDRVLRLATSSTILISIPAGGRHRQI